MVWIVLIGFVVVAAGAMLVIQLAMGGEGDHVDVPGGEVVTGVVS